MQLVWIAASLLAMVCLTGLGVVLEDARSETLREFGRTCAAARKVLWAQVAFLTAVAGARAWALDPLVWVSEAVAWISGAPPNGAP